MLEGVPWMVTGGEHSAEVGRTLAYIACGGSEGVVAVSDFKVRASSVPDGNIHVQPGAVACLNRFPGGGQQAYVVRNASDTVVALSPQGSSGVRYDLIALLVEDPEYPAQPDPADIASGPYVRIAVYEDVDPDTSHLAEVVSDQTGYALARVKFDVSDGTVTSADITDLRELLNPKTSVASEGRIDYIATGAAAALVVNDPVPDAGTVAVAIPSWCNRISFQITVGGLVIGDLDTAGVTPSGTAGVKAYLGALASNEVLASVDPAKIVTADTSFIGYYPTPIVNNAKFAPLGGSGGPSGDVEGHSAIAFSWVVDIDEPLRGTTQQFNVKLSTASVGGGQSVWVFPNAYMIFTALMQQSLSSVY